MTLVAPRNDDYVFQRNFLATSRLNYQYYLWQDTIRFFLHPSIPPLKPDARIADVATGSGIWLYHLYRQVPSSTRLVGIDISLEQIPFQSTLPPNISFQTWNFFDPPPPELQNSFDVVHMRLIAVAIKDGNAGKVLRNVKLLLKPGGYLQWEEHYSANAQVITTSEQDINELKGLRQLCNLLASPIMSTNGQLLVGPREWLETLTSTFEDHGFRDVHKTVYHDAPLMGMFWTDVYVASAAEFSGQMLDRDHDLASSLNDMILNVHKEKQTGAWVSNPKGVFTGRWSGET